MSKRCLSLDLGITTGYAIHSQSGDLLDHGEIAEAEFEAELKRLAHVKPISWSVAERPVIIRGPLGDRLMRIIATTELVLTRQVEMVDPSRWKSSPARKHPTPRGTSTHTKDAIRLGVWYLNQIGQL